MFELFLLQLGDFFIFPESKEFIHVRTSNSEIISLIQRAAELSMPAEIGFLPPLSKNLAFVGRIGTLCFVEHDKAEDVKFEGNEFRVYRVIGWQRFRILKVLESVEIEGSTFPVLAEAEIIKEKRVSRKFLSKSLKKRFNRVMKELRSFPFFRTYVPSPQKLARLEIGKLADIVVGLVTGLNIQEKLEFLENPDPVSRLKNITSILEGMLGISEDDTEVLFEPEPDTDAVGSGATGIPDRHLNKNLVDLWKWFEKIKDKLPPEGRNNIVLEFQKLGRMDPEARDYQVFYDYVEHVVVLFGREPTEDCRDLKKLRTILNEDHFGLEKIKSRIEEDVAVRIANPGQKAPILCFLGPPGVGKTSLGKSIARAMSKNFIRMSLGGIKDEAEIRGHRRTYVGAVPGRIINAIKNCGSSNPVFMMDEIDKIGIDFRGDPAAALLEVLDPEQNHSFVDHYTEVPYDLSKVFFIVTANTEVPIPPALRDRLEILRLPGYTEEEKIGIAKHFLVPKQLTEKGLAGKVNVVFEEDTFLKIIREYTSEAGVRNLERAIADICRKLIHKMVVDGSLAEGGKSFMVSPDSISSYLGPSGYFLDEALKNAQPGIINGLAWTDNGGRILLIEAEIIEKGKGSLILTGSLGEVMKESAQVAVSLLRSRIHTDVEKKIRNDIHLHAPEGATPKEGPSAGLAFFLCLYSFIKKIPVESKLAVTGEISLKGRVLAVGGIREKLIGADGAGAVKVIMPKKNEGDLADLSPSLKKKIEAGEFKIFLVEKVDEALDIAFPYRTEKA